MKYSLVVRTSVIAILVAGFTGCSTDVPVTHATPQDPTVTASPDDQGRSPASYFKAGDCLRDSITDGAAKTATVVDCSEPHAVEVWAVFMLPDGAFPGDATVKGFKDKCNRAAFEEYAPGVADKQQSDPSIHGARKWPDANSWAIGDRSVTCMVTFDTPRTGSIRDDNS